MFILVRPTIITVPMRIQKSGLQTLPNDTWTTITPWTVTLGYNDTIISNDGIFINNPGTYSILGNDQRGSDHSTTAARILVNGVIIATSTSGSALSVVSIASIDLNAGDIVTMQGYTNTVGTASRQTQDTSTYIEILPV